MIKCRDVLIVQGTRYHDALRGHDRPSAGKVQGWANFVCNDIMGIMYEYWNVGMLRMSQLKSELLSISKYSTPNLEQSSLLDKQFNFAL